IVVTGDITDLGTAEEYAQAAEVLTASVPIVIGPGNHDDRRAFRAGLLGVSTPDDGPINQELRVGDVLVAMCDSSIPGRPEGALEPATIEWLRTVLANSRPDDRILLGFHHPPVELFSPIVDPIRLGDPDRLGDIIRGDERIIGALCGHAHTAATTMFAGKPLVVAPSVSSVLGPIWESDVTNKPVVDYVPPPMIAIHALDDSRLITHFRVVA
uniref:metallophosphoesterase n=1 Tax=Aldersonia kunmingensis TaxID=408066 RepID=UPI0008317E01